MVQQQFERYRASPVTTELRAFSGRGHWLIAGPGWEDVADATLQWALAQASSSGELMSFRNQQTTQVPLLPGTPAGSP